MKVLSYIFFILSFVNTIDAKPPKEIIETEEEKQFKAYTKIYSDSITFSAYIDSIAMTYGFCFTNDTNNVYIPRPNIFGKNDKLATYKDGTLGLMEFLKHTVRYPLISRDNNIQGKVILKFLVNEDGTICNISVYKQDGIGLTEEIIRVLNLIKGNWMPAIIDNNKVKSYTFLSFTFKLA